MRLAREMPYKRDGRGMRPECTNGEVGGTSVLLALALGKRRKTPRTSLRAAANGVRLQATLGETWHRNSAPPTTEGAVSVRIPRPVFHRRGRMCFTEQGEVAQAWSHPWVTRAPRLQVAGSRTGTDIRDAEQTRMFARAGHRRNEGNRWKCADRRAVG